MSEGRKGVLCVCLGNICRSPLLQGVLEETVREAGRDDVIVDSAGTSTYHIGEGPDRRGVACARRHGIDTSGQQARQVREADFGDFDLIIVMDASNERDVAAFAPDDGGKAVVRTLMSYVPEDGRTDVPDCWYADDPEASFEDVYSVFVVAAPRILADLDALSK